MIKAGIIGGAGYTGGELIRILINHPEVDIEYIHSTSSAGKKLYEVHHDLLGETELEFSSPDNLNTVDVLFLCVGHGDAQKFLEKNKVDDSVVIIDLSQDHRDGTNGYVYGLPELFSNEIKAAKRIANPGCFATAIQLALLPMAKNGKLIGDLNISATTGSTGAGQSLSATSHFSWRNNNLSVYKAFTHQHLKEINRSLNSLKQNLPQLNFIPHRGDFTRGILASVNLKCELELDEIKSLYRRFYKDAPFVLISEQNIALKQVLNTNKCILYLEKHKDELLVVSIIDNLLKGASGQAVQNMNLIFGFDQKAGLKLKPIAF